MGLHQKLGAALLALTAGLILAVTSCAGDKREIKLTFSECPAAVQTAIRAHTGGLLISEVEKETRDDGRVVYDAKARKSDGKKIEIKVSADGTMVEFKEENGP